MIRRGKQAQVFVYAVIILASMIAIVITVPRSFGSNKASSDAPTLDSLEQLQQGHPGKAPTNVQGIVNRVDAVIVATIESFDTREVGVYQEGQRIPVSDLGGDYEQLRGVQQGVFAMTIEEILVDDGYIADAIALNGYPDVDSPLAPQVGKKYVLALFRQPNNLEYAITPLWGMYQIDGDEVKRSDGTEPKIEAPSSASEFIAEFREAAMAKRNLSRDLRAWNEPYADLPAGIEAE